MKFYRSDTIAQLNVIIKERLGILIQTTVATERDINFKLIGEIKDLENKFDFVLCNHQSKTKC